MREPATAEWRRSLVRLRAALGIGAAWIRHYRLRSALSVLGIAIAVMLVVSLAGLGHGVSTRGDTAIDSINRDLWMTTGPVELQPGAVGGTANPIRDAHGTVRRIESVDGVHGAEALSFGTVYVGNDSDRLGTVVGVGITGSAAEANVVEGRPFRTPDRHYANGSYDGPMSHEVLIDRRTARRFDVGINDTLHVGGTVSAAERNGFRVVGITPSFSRFLGAPTVTVHLSELQEISGTTRSDPAAIIGVTREERTPRPVLRERLQRQFPGYEIRTNDQQVAALLGRQAVPLAGATALVVVAVLASVALVANTLALFVHQQREPIAALVATGVRDRTLAALVLGQGLLLGVAGGLLGCLLAIPLTAGLNRIVAGLTGFGGLLVTPGWLYGAGFLLAVVVAVLGALIGAWRVRRLDPLRVLSRH